MTSLPRNSQLSGRPLSWAGGESLGGRSDPWGGAMKLEVVIQDFIDSIYQYYYDDPDMLDYVAIFAEALTDFDIHIEYL